jgi:hypothetical protein
MGLYHDDVSGHVGGRKPAHQSTGPVWVTLGLSRYRLRQQCRLNRDEPAPATTGSSRPARMTMLLNGRMQLARAASEFNNHGMAGNYELRAEQHHIEVVLRQDYPDTYAEEFNN